MLKAARPRAFDDACGGSFPRAERDVPPLQTQGPQNFLPFGFATPRAFCFLPCIWSLCGTPGAAQVQPAHAVRDIDGRAPAVGRPCDDETASARPGRGTATVPGR